MEWLKKMNGAIKYIEDHIRDDIDYEDIARISCCSVYHFQRLFSFIVDIPLSEYIRRRRLTLAAFELQNSDVRVIDLALRYRYESPDAFARAFKKIHGVTPTVARDTGVKLKAYPPLSFHISIKGDVEMNYKILEKDSYTVFGKSITIGLDDNPNDIIPKLWHEFQQDGTYQKICSVAGVKPYGDTLLDAAVYDFDNDGSYRNKYMINTLLPVGKEVPKELDVLTIPKSKWVVFSDTYETVEETSKVIQNLWKRAFTEWFPNSEFEVKKGPQLEVYPEDSKTVEVWVPIREK